MTEEEADDDIGANKALKRNEQVFTPSPDKLLTGDEVAQILSVSKAFAYQLIQTGELPSVRIGRAVRVRLIDLDEYINQNIFKR